MSSPFLFPSISSLPAGYDCTISLPIERLAQKVIRRGTIRATIRVFYEGDVVDAQEHRIEVKAGKALGDIPKFHWADHGAAWNGDSGFLDLAFRSEDGEPMFRDTALVSFYAIYSKAGKKSFFSDNAFRYGSPPTINQIASFGKYVDTYPVIHLDRKRDLGETITLINPYKKPVLARLMTQDGRELRGRIKSNSVLNVRLSPLLKDDENEWMGQIQLTATNRLVTFHIKHSLTDPTVISDHEHLDAFRDDATHVPLTQMLRLRWGQFLNKHGLAG